MKKLLLIFSVLFAFLLILTGCSIKLTNNKLSDGGVFRSTNHGQNWEQIVFAGLTGKKQNKKVYLDKIEVKKILFDPLNSEILYLATNDSGLYLSLNQGNEWQQILKTSSTINDFAIDYKNSQIIYVAIDNKIYKTGDLGHSWNIIYTDSQPKQTITVLATDDYDNRRVYAGTSDGRLLRSLDYGNYWYNLVRIKSAIRNIIINPKDTRKIYLSTSQEGIYYSADLGQTWQEPQISKLEQQFSGIRQLYFSLLDPTQENNLIIATKYGLLKSSDGGTTWNDYKLITLPGGVTINTVAINPKNSNEILYSVNNILSITYDNGQTWTNNILPTTRQISQILFNPDNPEIIYFGTKLAPKEKKGFFF